MIQIIESLFTLTVFNMCLYGLFSIGPYIVLWRLRPSYTANRQIQIPQLFSNQVKFEIKNSLYSLLAVSALLTPLYMFIQMGLTQISTDFNLSGWILLPIFILCFLIQDIWFYWSHRWLHSDWAFPRIHWIHHRSKVPTPLASHSFHWLEALIQYVFLYPLCFILPMTLGDLVLFMGLMHFFATWGHFNYELMPKSIWNHPLGSWITTSSHHNDHHRFAKENYGLYLKYWDKRFKTLNPETERHFIP